MPLPPAINVLSLHLFWYTAKAKLAQTKFDYCSFLPFIFQIEI